MDRVQAILKHPDFEAYMLLNEKQEINREFCCHQFQHAADVARICYILYLEQGKNIDIEELKNKDLTRVKELIYAMGFLHDIGRWREYQDNALDHAIEGAKLAPPILEDAGFAPEEIETAVKAIGEHRNSQATGLGGVLYRADKLSRNCSKCRARDKCYKLHKMETAEGLIY